MKPIGAEEQRQRQFLKKKNKCEKGGEKRKGNKKSQLLVSDKNTAFSFPKPYSTSRLLVSASGFC
jgi:hypothetical protein